MSKHQPNIAIVAAEWNDFIVSRLIEGALTSLEQHGIAREFVPVVRCPGSFEVPLVAKRVIATQKPDAVICLGVVIKGETAHFEYVCEPVAHALMEISLTTGIPCLFGVLMTHTIEQATARADGAMGNKGAECAEAALSLVHTLRSLV
jgi:6,7-dimethyl-8-ribityllumazine synthase